ncbi:MAG TPA: MFS transporter [Ktedonobacteraceae bacterium]|nr:MFS transporter [Ktedonobacteraceae bacterium]
MILFRLTQSSALPLLVGTFLLRFSGGANTVFMGRFLAGVGARNGLVITSIEVGLLSVVYFVVELTLSPIVGSLSDRWGRRLFLWLGPLFGIIQVTLLFFTPEENTFGYLLCLQVLAGISSAMQVPAVLGYLADYTTQQPNLRARIMSFYEMVTSGGLAVGVAAAGFIWEHLERGSFLLLGVGYLLAAACMLSVPRTGQLFEHARARALLSRYGQILRSPRLFIFIPAWVCIFALLGIWYSQQLTFILSSTNHWPGQTLVGSLSGVGGASRLSMILGSVVLVFGLCLLFWAFFLNRVPRLWLMFCSIGGIYLTCVALAGLNHGGGERHFLLIICLFLLLLGVFALTGFAPAALSYLADISEETARDRGLLMGLYSVFLGLGQLLGNGLGGVFAQRWGFDGLVYLTALLACVALISLLILFRYERRSPLKLDLKKVE